MYIWIVNHELVSTNSVMPYYGPQEDEYTLFLERTFLMSGVVVAVGCGALSIMAQKK